MLVALRDGYHHFMRDPLRVAIATLLFLLTVSTGFLAGIGALIYIQYLKPDANLPFQLRIFQHVRSMPRLTSAFLLGLSIWAICCFIPFLQSYLIFGIPAAWIITQPLWFALLLADSYDLAPKIALKATCKFTCTYPLRAVKVYALGLLAFSGLLIFGLGVLFTLPVALFATLQLMNTMQQEFSLSIQQAYGTQP